MIPHKIIVAPDYFKGSLSAQEFCAIAAGVIGHHFPGCRVMGFPLADGGEGSIDCFVSALTAEKRYMQVSGPLGQPIESFYALLPGNVAMVEMAAAAGLPLLQGRLDVLHSNTLGVGQLMSAALAHKPAKLIVGLGGSCTTEAACGAAVALGVRFYDSAGKDFIPSGQTLCEIATIDISGRDKRLENCEIELMCDITNPMYGETGAAYIFAPQKGADAATVQLLDKGLRHVAAIIERDLGLDVSMLPGGGAAGAMGAGLAAFCNGRLKSGIEVVLDAVSFDEAIADADIIITGEGCLDAQSAGGKAVSGVCRRAAKQNKPVIAVAGAIRAGYEPLYNMGLGAAFDITPEAADLQTLMLNSKENLERTLANICRLLKLQI